MPKYYFSTIVARPMVLSGRTIKFLICSMAGGRANGIHESTDPEEIKVLDDAVRSKRGVSEISAESYENLKKKASQTRQSVNSNGSSPPRVIRIPQMQPMAIAQPPPAKVADSVARDAHGNLQSNPDEPTDLPKMGDLIKINRVNPPQPFAAADSRMKKSAARATTKAAKAIRAAI